MGRKPLLRLLLCAPLCLIAADAPPPGKLIVFANRSTPVNHLNNGQLRDVLLGNTASWSNGRPVKLLFADDASMAVALKRILKMSRDDYDNHFAVRRYQGQDVVRPQVLRNVDAVLRQLTATPGAITVLQGEADMTVAGAKPLRIDGKLPDEDGYRY